MLLSRLLANFTRGQSDSLRKAMGKKLIDKMNELEALFMEGGQANGHDPKVLQKIWADWKKFASYAFNKSHATCYSWVAYQTGYLKAHYPAEYMAAVLTHNRSDSGKLIGFMDECKSMGITVKGPDVNESVRDFGVTSDGNIRFGLSAISGIGDTVVDEIVKARGSEPFKDIYDFVERVPSQSINRRVFENLALAGAFDCFGAYKREDLVDDGGGHAGDSAPEVLLRYGAMHQNAIRKQEASLFDFDDEQLNAEARPKLRSAEEWAPITKLDKERELVGMYLSAHPLDPYYLELNYGTTFRLSEREDAKIVENQEVSFGGIVTECTRRTTRKGSPMMIVKLEDFTGTTEIVMFNEQMELYGHLTQVGKPILIRGTYNKQYDNLRFNISSIIPLETVKGKMLNSITIALGFSQCTPTSTASIIDQLREGEGQRMSLSFSVDSGIPGRQSRMLLSSGKRIAVDKKFIKHLEETGIPFKLDFDKNLAS